MGYFDTLKNLEGIRQRENQNALARQAGGMLSQGDQTGARNALWRGGELDAGFKIEEGMASSRKAQAEAMERFTTGVSRMLDDPSYANDPNGADRAWNDATQFASQLGLNPDALNQDRDAFLKNPKGWANFWNQKAKEEQFTLSPGSARYDAAGRVIASQPFAPQYRTVGDGQSLVEVGGDNGNPIPGGTPGFNGDARMPRNQRNANPGNIEDGPFARSLPGYAGSDGRFAKFSDPNAGQNAQLALLDSYAKRGLNTVAGIINRWAPPSENDTQAYARFVAGKLGVSPDQPLDMNNPQVKQALAAAITTFEGGPGSGGARTAGGARVVAQGAPKPAGGQTPPSGFRWKADGSLEPIPGGPADTISQGGKVTEGERTAGFLASRLADSLKNLTAISAASPQADKPGILEVGADVVTGGRATNMVRSGERQQVVANQLDVLDAALTLGTGAAYTREQLLNYRETYFPALTDKPATVQAKRQKLIALLNAAKIKAGRSAPPELDQALEAARAQWTPQARAQPAKPAQGKQAAQGGIPTLTPEQAAKLPKGSRFRTTDGRVLVRQ